MTKTFFSCLVLLVLSTVVLAQNSNSSTTTARPRTAANSNAQAKPSPKPSPKPSATPAGAKAPASAATSETVQSAFNKIIDGIRKSNVDLVMGGYLNTGTLNDFLVMRRNRVQRGRYGKKCRDRGNA